MCKSHVVASDVGNCGDVQMTQEALLAVIKLKLLHKWSTKNAIVDQDFTWKLHIKHISKKLRKIIRFFNNLNDTCLSFSKIASNMLVQYFEC